MNDYLQENQCPTLALFTKFARTLITVIIFHQMQPEERN